jgi:hypothetical protein
MIADVVLLCTLITDSMAVGPSRVFCGVCRTSPVLAIRYKGIQIRLCDLPVWQSDVGPRTTHLLGNVVVSLCGASGNTLYWELLLVD